MPHNRSTRAYNFSAGPAALPTPVLEQVRDELLDWKGAHASVMEISHRSPSFISKVAQSAQKDLRDLLQVPENYHILFIQGGGRGQFSMVPLNLLNHSGQKATYFNTGFWSRMATEEAQRYGTVQVIAGGGEDSEGVWRTDPSAARLIQKESVYAHCVTNETLEGIVISKLPRLPANMPWVADMSSHLLSEPLQVEDFGIIYACAQKNIGPAGLTIVLIRDDLLDRAHPMIPTPYRYRVHAQAQSLYQTPPTFAWYVAGLVFQWIAKEGGLAAMAARNQRKAAKVYRVIDAYDCYQNRVASHCRSRMNIIFHLSDEQQEAAFLRAAEAADLLGLKGHSLVGGVRASLYNAVSEEAVDALVDFMEDFAQHHA